MPNTKLNNLGEITSNFLLNDWSVYIMNTSATGGYDSEDWELLGYTSPEKTMNHINEKYVREDKIPRVPTYTKTIRIGMEMTFDLSNQNLEIESLLTQGTLQNTGTRMSFGTKQANQQYRAIRLVSQRDDNKYLAITIPKCELMLNGEKTLGGESEMVTPIMAKAYYNASANATGNLYYMSLWASNVSPTADVPVGFN